MEHLDQKATSETPETRGESVAVDQSDALALARQEAAAMKETAARAQAELINYKARAEREQARLRALGGSRTVLALLPVLDNLDRALSQEGDLRDGVKLIRDQFVAALAGLSVEEISPLGEDFSPLEHDAVGMTPVDDQAQDGKIVDVYQKGYRMAGTVIRPARVHVGHYQPREIDG